MAFTPEEKKRIAALLADPKLLNQGSKNCCGTIVTISGVLELYGYDLIRKDLFNNLFTKIEHDFNVQGPMSKAYHIGSRLQKRIDAGIIKETTDGTSVDIKLGIAMLLMFKHHLEEKKKSSVWKQCEAYSVKMAPKWTHGAQLKSLGASYTLTDMTYKNGDIAITQQGMRELLPMVSRAKDKTIHEVDLTSADVTQYLAKLKSYHDGTKMMIVMGVKIDTQKDQSEGGLVHWVYVPHANFTHTGKVEVWTWGQRYEITDLKNLGLDNRGKWGGLRSFAIRMV